MLKNSEGNTSKKDECSASREYGYIYSLCNCPALMTMRRMIKKEDIAEERPKWCLSGVEYDSHCTLFYGIESERTFEKDCFDERLKVFFREHPRTYFIPSMVSIFRDTRWDCLVVEAARGIHRTVLETIHKEFTSRFYPSIYSNSSYTDRKYIPHVTIGYVKPGLGNEYLDKFNEVYEGRLPMPVDVVNVELANGDSRLYELARV